MLGPTEALRAIRYRWGVCPFVPDHGLPSGFLVLSGRFGVFDDIVRATGIANSASAAGGSPGARGVSIGSSILIGGDTSIGYGIQIGGGISETRSAQVGLGEEPVGGIRAVYLPKKYEKGHVGESGRVVDEVRHLPIDVELLEHHVSHRHRERGVGTGRYRKPIVCELHVFGIVGGDYNHLLSPVAGFYHKVGVRCAGDRDVRPPDHEVTRVPPIGRFGHIGLVSEYLGRRRRKIRVPVIEGELSSAGEGDIAGSRYMGHRRHGRDGAHCSHAVGAVLLDGVDMSGGAKLQHILPGRANETAVTPGTFVA